MITQKKNIAIVAGGDSSEIDVSLRSAAGLMSFIDGEKYNKYIVTIVGKNWQVETHRNVSLQNTEKYEIDKNDFSFTKNGEKIRFDFAYITIHGTPGENGILQGYFELLKIPYSCCDVLAAALTFNKFVCNRFLASFAFNVAQAIYLRKGDIDTTSAENVEKVLGFPCFVKPATGGSSFGVTKVKTAETLQPAIDKAFSESNEVVIEQFIKGTELTCGMYSTSQKTVIFPITEVVSENEFFDYDAKYKGKSQEITPARISEKLTQQIQDFTRVIYKLLACRGIVRIDYIITKDEKIYILEVNTTPGMTETSFIPQQIAAAGLDIKEILTEIIEN